MATKEKNENKTAAKIEAAPKTDETQDEIVDITAMSSEEFAEALKNMTPEQMAAHLEQAREAVKVAKAKPKRRAPGTVAPTGQTTEALNAILAAATGKSPNLSPSKATDEEVAKVLTAAGYTKHVPHAELDGIKRIPAFRHETLPTGLCVVKVANGYHTLKDGFVVDVNGNYSVESMRADWDAKGGGNTKVLEYWSRNKDEGPDNFSDRLRQYRIKRHGENQANVGIVPTKAEREAEAANAEDGGEAPDNEESDESQE